MTRRHRRHKTTRTRIAFKAMALTSAIALALTPAQAVILGEMTVDTALGQPLSARVPIELHAGETMGAQCVSVSGTGTGELGRLPATRVMAPETATPGRYELRITTTQPLQEPMYDLPLQVRCPGTALLLREYVLMLDLPGTAAAPAALAPAGIEPARIESAAAAPAPVPLPAAAPARTAASPAPSLDAGDRYRVAAGDTLFSIASRVSGRGNRRVWSVAEEIHAANPEAFIGGNPNLIKLGSEIVIPASSVSAAPTAQQTASPSQQVSPAPVTPEPELLSTPAKAPASITAPVPTVVAEAATAPEAAAKNGARSAAQPLPAPVQRTAARQEDSTTSTWLATIAGIIAGAAACLLLLRQRLMQALRHLLVRRRPAAAVATTDLADDSANIGLSAHAAPRFSPKFPDSTPLAERSMFIVEEGTLPPPANIGSSVGSTQEMPAATQASGNDNDGLPMDSSLTQLLADDLALDVPRSGLELGNSLDKLDLDLSAATADSLVDTEIGDLGDDTAMTPTTESPRPWQVNDTVEHIDLLTLSQQATEDDQVSQTLRDALNLLESDYEDELTASQAIDRRKLTSLLDGDATEDVLARTGTEQFPRRH